MIVGYTECAMGIDQCGFQHSDSRQALLLPTPIELRERHLTSKQSGRSRQLGTRNTSRSPSAAHLRSWHFEYDGRASAARVGTAPDLL